MWVIQAGVAAVLSLPIVLLSRHLVHWRAWELLALVFPFCVWIALWSFWPGPSSAKGISNGFVEPIVVGLAVPAAALFRVKLARGSEGDKAVFAVIVLASLCVAAGIIYFVAPNLGGSLG